MLKLDLSAKGRCRVALDTLDRTGDLRPLLKLLRSAVDLTPECRATVAAIIEGTYKRRAGRKRVAVTDPARALRDFRIRDFYRRLRVVGLSKGDAEATTARVFLVSEGAANHARHPRRKK